MINASINWWLFWNAFAAIGTTIGSLITATAVIIAFKQYRQPFKKYINIEFSAVIANLAPEPDTYYNIYFSNRGIRDCRISSLMIKGKNNDIYILPPKSIGICSNPVFPVLIKPEESANIFMNYDEFRNLLKEELNKCWIPKHKHLYLYAKDSTGEIHCGKTTILMKGFAK